ncbi:MAG: hypothetical protein KIT71_11965 [Nitrospira sp.]|nr:hypothetical protein [Nitrospira sp.]MCW5780194.1 hypothetical protein [Nitrospira sp.]
MVDPVALRSRRCCIDEAINFAVGRALAKSWREVIRPRGGYVGVRLNSPEFFWRGEALGNVDEDLKRELEEKIRAAILLQVESKDIGQYLRRKHTSPLTSTAFERLDAERYHGALDLYEVPGYQGGGENKAVKVATKKGGKAPVEYVEKDDWFVYPGKLLDKPKLYMRYLREMLDNWSIPSSGAHGMFWRESDKWVLSVHSEDEWYGWVSWDHFSQRVVVPDGKTFAFKVNRVKPYVGPATARLIPASEAREIMRQEIRMSILDYAQKNGPIGAEFQEQLEEKTDAQLKISFPIADLSGNVVEVDANGLVNWIYHPDGPVFNGIANLAPLTHVVKVKKEEPSKDAKEGDPNFGEAGASKKESGEGKGSGSGKGKRAKSGAGEVDREGKSPGALDGYGEPGGVPSDAEMAKAFGFVYTGDESTSPSKGSAFPSVGGGKVRKCESGFQGEPSLKELGADGELLREVINEIAQKLQIDPCEYAAEFAFVACEVQAGRAVSVSEYSMSDDHAGFVQPVTPKPVSIGTFEFIPAVSPAIQFMRHLGSVSPRISFLIELILTIYKKPEHLPKVLNTRYTGFHGWFVDFAGPMNDKRRRGAAHIFAMTCRIVLMQLLRSSHKGIQDRLSNIDAYSKLFHELIQLHLADIDELVKLRDLLKKHTFDITKPLQEVGEYMLARDQLVAALEFRNPFEGPGFGIPGSIVKAADGTTGVRDSKGNIWTMDQLERMLSMQRDTINQIDPLIPQITMDKTVLARFTANPGNTRRELKSLLEEMREANEEKIKENRNDWRFGFRASSIRSDWHNRTIPGCRYALSGVHTLAHEQIGEFFGGDWSYAEGVDSLLRAQESWEEFKMIAEFTGVIFLAIVCAPLAFVVGGALSIYHYHEAKEKEELFKALLDPELIISRAEVEAELFAAELGMVLSFIPDAGPILRGGSKLASGVVQGEARVVARALGRRLARRITVDMVRALKGNLALSFAKALTTAQGMNLFLGKLLIEPTIAQMQRDLATYEQIEAMAKRQ